MKRVSTHVLDLTLGKPASDVPVRLERQDASGNWRQLAAARTDADGRSGNLLPAEEDLSPGVYRICFGTVEYFSAQRIDVLFDVVEVAFRVREGETQFHIPLLLSPNGYTTYRGS